MHAVTAWMVHPLTGILVGTKMNKQLNKTNKNYKDLCEDIERNKPNMTRRRFRVEEAKFILNRIAENRRNGTPHPNDNKDLKRYGAILERLSGERHPALNLLDQSVNVPNITEDQPVTNKLTLALIDEEGFTFKPVDAKHWPPLEGKLKHFAKIRAKKTKEALPSFKVCGLYKGFLLIKCRNKPTKMFLLKTFNRVRFSIKGKRLGLIPSSQLPSILQNMSVIDASSKTENRIEERPSLHEGQGFQLDVNYFDSNIPNRSEGSTERLELTPLRKKEDFKYKQNKCFLQMLAGVRRLTGSQKRQRAKKRREILSYERIYNIKKEDCFPQEFFEDSNQRSLATRLSNSESDISSLSSSPCKRNNNPRREPSPDFYNEFPSTSRRQSNRNFEEIFKERSERNSDVFSERSERNSGNVFGNNNNRNFEETFFDSRRNPEEEQQFSQHFMQFGENSREHFNERQRVRENMNDRLDSRDSFNEARRKLQRFDTDSREQFHAERMRRNSIEERRPDNFDKFEHEMMERRHHFNEMPFQESLRSEHFERSRSDFERFELPSTSRVSRTNRETSEWGPNDARDNWLPNPNSREFSSFGNNEIERKHDINRDIPSNSNSDLQIVIVDRNQNEGRISFEIWQKMEKLLLEFLAREMQRTNHRNMGLFDGLHFQNGFKIITCENMESYQFIKRFIYEQINCAPNVNFDAILVRDLPGRVMAKVWVKPPNIDDLAAVNILQAQNPLCLSQDWIFVKSRERSNRNGKDLYFSISFESANRLQQRQGEIRYGTFQLKMIVLD